MNRKEIEQCFKWARVGKIAFCQNQSACACAVTFIVLHNEPEITPAIFLCYEDSGKIRIVNTGIQLRYLGNWIPELEIQENHGGFLIKVVQEVVDWVDNPDGSAKRITDREQRVAFIPRQS